LAGPHCSLHFFLATPYCSLHLLLASLNFGSHLFLAGLYRGLHLFLIDLHFFWMGSIFPVMVTRRSKSAMIIWHVGSNLTMHNSRSATIQSNPTSDTSCQVLVMRCDW
jgi:hypothetical protein